MNETQSNSSAAPRRRFFSRRPAMAALGLAAVAVIAFGLVHASKTVHAGPGNDHAEHHQKAKAHMAKVLSHIGASDAQKRVIYAEIKQAMRSMHKLHTTHKDLHKELEKAFLADTVDRAAVDAVRVKANHLHSKMSETIVQAMLEIAEVLTKEQRAKLLPMFERHFAGGGLGMKGKRGSCGGSH